MKWKWISVHTIIKFTFFSSLGAFRLSKVHIEMTHSFLSLIRLRSSFNSTALWLWQTSLTMSIRFYWMYCDLTETLPLLRVLCSFSKRIGDNANTHTHMRMCYACDTIVLRSRWDTTIEWVSNGSFCMCEINDKYLLPIDDCTTTK